MTGRPQRTVEFGEDTPVVGCAGAGVVELDGIDAPGGGLVSRSETTEVTLPTPAACVHCLTMADAIRDAAMTARRAIVIGGGWIGAEVAPQLGRERGAVPCCIIPEFGGPSDLPDDSADLVYS